MAKATRLTTRRSMCLEAIKRFAVAFTIVPMLSASGQNQLASSQQSTAVQSAITQIRPDGTACISCHSPLGTELFTSGFSMADFARRASRHMGKSDAALVAETLAQTQSRKSESARLFPARASQTKSTGTQLDSAFGRRLRVATPVLASGPIGSPAAAMNAAAQLLKLHPATIQPSIRIDPLSREPGRSDNGLLIGDWIPDIPLSRERTSRFAEKATEVADHAASDDPKRNDLALQMV